MTTHRILQYACLASILFCAACAHEVPRGHLKEDEKVSLIKVGTTTRADLSQEMGSPSTESSFGNKTWYYISSVEEQRSILPTRILEQHVLEITFDANDVVTGVKQYTLEDSKPVEIVQDVTPTEGQHLGFFEQILSNLGRFNKDNGTSGVSNDHSHQMPSPTGYPGR